MNGAFSNNLVGRVLDLLGWLMALPHWDISGLPHRDESDVKNQEMLLDSAHMFLGWSKHLQQIQHSRSSWIVTKIQPEVFPGHSPRYCWCLPFGNQNVVKLTYMQVLAEGSPRYQLSCIIQRIIPIYCWWSTTLSLLDIVKTRLLLSCCILLCFV